MALANFFDRAATAAAQVLRGFDLEAFERKLSAKVIGVAFDAEAARQPAGWALLELTVNLLARLYPTIAVNGSSRGAGPYRDRLEALARAINPDIGLDKTLKSANPIVAVGHPQLPKGRTVFFAGSDGWFARLSRNGPVPPGSSMNPFGAGAAACFAAANVFRKVFAEQLPGAAADDELTLSLLDYRQAKVNGSNPPLPAVDLRTTSLVGVGAIGNAFVWALQRLPELRGTLDVIDHEPVELSNLQRYVLTTQAHRQQKKAELAASLVARSGLIANGIVGTWSDYVQSVDSFKVERVAVALDTVRDRIAVQAALPRHVVNAWTQTHDLGLSRHEFLGDDACLMCLYLPDREVPDEDEIVMQATGLSDQMEVRKLLSQNPPVDRHLLGRVAQALSLPLDALLPFENKPMRSFYTEAFCGGAVFRLSGGARGTPTLVPMAFQSALAGIMLAADVVAHGAQLVRRPPPVTTTINLLRPLTPFVSFPRRKDPRGRCICQDPDYIRAFEAKWNSGLLPSRPA